MDNGGGVVVHIHHIVGVGNLHSPGQILNAVFAHDTQNFLATSNQRDLRSELPVCLQSTQNSSLRRQVSAHGIENYFHGVTLSV